MRKVALCIVLLVLISISAISQTASCSFVYRKRITFDPTKVMGASDLSNFPALIKITSDNDLRTTANSGHVQNSNGYDIIFTDADGVTLLNFQLVKYTATTGQLTAWVKIPTLSTSLPTYIYMYYGNSSITTDQSSTSTWSNYNGVWHFENNGVTDSSPNAYSTTNFSTTNQSPAFIDDGRADAGTQWIELTSSFPNLTSDFSISAWVYTSNNSKSGQRIMCDDVNNSGGWGFSINDAGDGGSVRFFSRGSNPVIVDAPAGTIANNTWYYATAVADITNGVKYIYINGTAVASNSFTGTWTTDAGNTSIAGETASGETGNRLQGRIDEVRVVKSALSASWIQTEYNNQNSPSTFYSITSEPATFTGGTSVNWNTASNWSSGSVPSASADVIINSSTNQPSVNVNTQVGSIWIRNGSTVTIGAGISLSVLYDVTNCGVLTGANANSELKLNSTSSYAQVQNLSGTGTYNLSDLTINNTNSVSPSVVLGKDVTVNNDLVLTSGIVTTTSVNILNLGNSATSTSGSSSSYISGPMTKVGTTAFVFPVGKGGSWRRVGISGPTSSSTFKAEYFNTAYTSTTPVNSPLYNVSTMEYWQLDRSVGTGSASVSLYWEAAGASGINNCADLTIARWNGTGWDERAATTSTSSSCSSAGTGVVTTTAQLGAFSPFTFGSKLSSVNPLPVTLADFNAYCFDGTIHFEWKTSAEIQNDHFSIEYSSDANTWWQVLSIKGLGTSSAGKDYSAMLPDAQDGYYRLVQVDWGGERVVKKVVFQSCAELKGSQVYPNPSSGDFTVKIQSGIDLTIPWLVMDEMGRVAAQGSFKLHSGNNLLPLELSLSPGVYFLKLSSESAPMKLIIIR